jgi:hypothetical protein
MTRACRVITLWPQMTREQIIWNFVIALVVGVFLLVMGAVLGPPIKRLRERAQRPSPLTPQTRGQLVTNLATYEESLKRLNHFSTHPKDLFLHLIQLVLAVLLFCIMAFFLYTLSLLMRDAPNVEAHFIFVIVLLVLAGGFCGFGIVEAGQMSDKKIDDTKASIQKRIDETNKLLEPPKN